MTLKFDPHFTKRRQQMSEGKRMSEQEQAARKQFLQMVASGGVAALDRFGNAIQEGASVLYHPPFDLMFQVTNVGPALDPRVPPGIMVVTLTVTVPIQVRANIPTPGMLALYGETPKGSDDATPLQAKVPDAAATPPADATGGDRAPAPEPEPLL